jgi:hypothetical protein
LEKQVFGGKQESFTDPFHENDQGKRHSCGSIFVCGWFNSLALAYDGLRGTPVIKSLPRDWNQQDVYPVPIPYFISLESTFWDVHLRKYKEALKMNPKTLGVRHSIKNDTRQMFARNTTNFQLISINLNGHSSRYTLPTLRMQGEQDPEKSGKLRTRS